MRRTKKITALPHGLTPSEPLLILPPETHPLKLAEHYGIPVVRCARKPVNLPFCWLEEDGSETWLLFSCMVAGDCETQQWQREQMARVMQRGTENQRRMVLLYGNNEPSRQESGTVIYSVFREAGDNELQRGEAASLYVNMGSAAFGNRYSQFWNEREYLYRKYRVPGPDSLPDEDLQPLVARNRIFLLPPTEPQMTDDPRSAFWNGYGKLAEWDPHGRRSGASGEEGDPERTAAREGKEQERIRKAEQRAEAQARRVKEREARLAAKAQAKQAKAAVKSLPKLPPLPHVPSLPNLPK